MATTAPSQLQHQHALEIAKLTKPEAQKSQSNWARSWRRLRKHRMAIGGAILLLFLILYVVIGSFVFTEKQARRIVDPANADAPPSLEHPFGLDSSGRDMFIRTIYGGQISLFIGMAAVVLEIAVGTVIGVVAGYFSGKNMIDSILMRFVEVMLSIPQLLIVLLAVHILAGHATTITVLGREFNGIMIIIIVVIGLTSWMSVARIVRATVLSVREQEYVTAARSVGSGDWRIVMKHILPNCLSPIIVSATLGVGAAIILESYLGFLGAGVPEPNPTWGSMLNSAHNEGIGYWHLWFFPGILIVLTVLAINFLGDGLRDAFDPKQLNN